MSLLIEETAERTMKRLFFLATVVLSAPFALRGQVVAAQNALALPANGMSCEIGSPSKLDSTFETFHFEEVDDSTDDRALDVQFDSTGAMRLLTMLASHRLSDGRVFGEAIVAKIGEDRVVDGIRIVDTGTTNIGGTTRGQIAFSDKDKSDLLALGDWLWRHSCREPRKKE